MYGIIYCTTNLINNKKYIGKKKWKTQNFENYLGSGINLTRAIKKYGKENFKREVLCECSSLEELNEKEKYFIEKFNAIKSPEFYNIAKGGDGGDMSHCITYNRICKYTLKGEYIKTYLNAREAAKDNEGYSNKEILKCCWNQKNKYKNFIFKFEKETSAKNISPWINSKGICNAVNIEQLDLQGNLIKVWKNIAETERILNINNISAVINGRQKTAGGYKWKYSNEIAHTDYFFDLKKVKL